MKNIFIYLSAIFFISISCKKESAINETKNNYVRQEADRTLKNNKKITCDDVIYNIVKSSDLNLNDYKNYFVRVEDVKSDSITIKVYFENNLSDNPKKKEMVESTIAWLLFLPNDDKLLNITADPENPTKVNYKMTDISVIYDLCNIPKKKKDSDKLILDNNNEKECKIITVEMGKGEECILKNSNIQNVYSNIIKNEEVDDYKYLLTSLPKNNKVIEINKNGLLNIEYKVIKDKIDILFNYDGGVTEVIIEKKAENVLRRIVYYAD